MAAQPPPLSPDATRAQALAYLAKYWGHVKYHNEVKTPFEGMGYAQIYDYVEKRAPAATPYQVAQQTADLLLSSAFAKVVGGVVTGAGNATGEIAQGTVGGLAQTAGQLSGPLSGIAAVGDFFSRLTNPNTWLRIGEVLLGIVLIAVGLAKMTHAVPIATAIAAKVP
jgi:hypothetical protein